MYIYISNENETPIEVYFDDFKVEHIKSKMVQADDYYPFGLTHDGNMVGEPYRYGYQGQYNEEDRNTGWNDFMLRSYDPRIGRWVSTDPYGQFYSPYVGMGNNPTAGFDADGGFWEEFGNWIMTGHWISSEGLEFIKNTPGATYNGWQGDKLTGFASVGYVENGLPAITFFNAVDDLPFFNFYRFEGVLVGETGGSWGGITLPGLGIFVDDFTDEALYAMNLAITWILKIKDT